MSDTCLTPKNHQGLIKYLPNSLSLFRAVSPLILLETTESRHYILSLLIFLFAYLSDFLDGFIARKFHVSSFFGAMLDAVADKLLVNILFIYFYILFLLPEWLIIVTLLRDFCILLLAPLFFKLKNKQAHVLLISKLNTTLQFLLITLIYIEILFSMSALIKICLIYTVGCTTILSAVSYILLLLRTRQAHE